MSRRPRSRRDTAAGPPVLAEPGQTDDAEAADGDEVRVVGWELTERRPGFDGEWNVTLALALEGPVDPAMPRRIPGVHHPPIDRPHDEVAAPGVVWLGGVGGGTSGPARGMYPLLARALARDGVASLRLDYRVPHDLRQCIVDAIVGVGFLREEGSDPIALVGHSAGGAVAITTGAMLEGIATVVALATQSYGTDLAPELAPASLLLLHGLDDPVLPAAASTDVRARSGASRTALELLPAAGHSFEGREEEARRIVADWLRHELVPAAAARRGGSR